MLTSGEVRTLCDIPRGAVPLAVVEITEFLDEDGQRRFSVRGGGEVPLSTMIGLLRLAEHYIIADSADW